MGRLLSGSSSPSSQGLRTLASSLRHVSELFPTFILRLPARLWFPYISLTDSPYQVLSVKITGEVSVFWLYLGNTALCVCFLVGWKWERFGTVHPAPNWNQKDLVSLSWLLHFPAEKSWPKYLASLKVQFSYLWSGVNPVYLRGLCVVEWDIVSKVPGT